MELGGVALCIDKNKETIVDYVKSLNNGVREPVAHFYECDVEKLETLKPVITQITNDIGDITVVANCSPLKELERSYQNVSRASHFVLPKGH